MKSLTDELLEALLYDQMVTNWVEGGHSKDYLVSSWYHCVTFLFSWYKAESLSHGRKKEKARGWHS